MDWHLAFCVVTFLCWLFTWHNHKPVVKKFLWLRLEIEALEERICELERRK
jgi:hypothetical protein